MIVDHRGGLADWLLTDGAPTPESDGAFWKYWFDARLFEDYEFEVEVLKASQAAAKYNPTLVFHV